MKGSRITETGLLLFARHRKAGQGEISGEMRSWEEADHIGYIRLGDEKAYLQKRRIADEAVSSIYAKLENVSWGALIDVKLSGNIAVDVRVRADVFADLEDMD